MDNRIDRELARLRADIRDDIARAKYLGKASVGLWLLMAYEDRVEKLLERLDKARR
ncbi:hypothetical protein RSO41_14150 [Halomonas sp. I1]|uniref:hypothetical protein n=1 Tax=Halomonas sp. I1 TaxID=393536 RepID=UPI0028DD4391|nr:hypothetical protein [Halomonas sp. I1]MDT8895796.1 hypothetical protein [Halomonas sp. I1]